MKSLVVGITGGIGSGKSTVSEIFENENCVVLYADDIAKDVIRNNEKVKEKISKTFGAECFNNGKLNAKVLAEKVFNDSEKLNKLNSIVHPPTIKNIEQQILHLEKFNKLIFVEAALIFEAKMDNLFDYIILVTADEEIRINRVLQRGVETASEIKNRMMNQMPEDKKNGKSDFVIMNNDSLEELKTKTLFFLNLLKNLL